MKEGRKIGSFDPSDSRSVAQRELLVKMGAHVFLNASQASVVRERINTSPKRLRIKRRPGAPALLGGGSLNGTPLTLLECPIRTMLLAIPERVVG